MLRGVIALAGIAALAACGSADERRSNEGQVANKVATSGKDPKPLGDVPPEVLEAARSAQPTMTLVGAEAEVREGRNYHDVAGTLPDGSEIELDMMQAPDGSWSVVETQRDIAFAAAPEPVRAATAKADASFQPVRVIESRQADGVVIYELFGPAPAGGGEGRKVEIKYDGRKAELLTKEWAH